MNLVFRLPTLLVAATLAAAPIASSAHRPWLLPSATVVDGDAPVVSVDAAISEDLFEFDSFPLALDALAVTAPDGHAVDGEGRTATRRRTSFDVKLAQKGTYRISGTTDAVMASWKQNGEPHRWRGAPSALAKELPPDAQDVQVTRMIGRAETFVTYDAPSAVAPGAAQEGLSLQPLTSPTDLSNGDTSRFRLLLDGKPYAIADVTVIRGDNRYRYKLGEIALKTDADGVVAVTWPEAGRYWLGASHGGRGPGGPDGGASSPARAAPAAGTVDKPVRRESYSATFEVLPK